VRADRRDPVSESNFGNVAAGLTRIALQRTVPFVLDGLRPFPFPSANSGAVRHMREINRADFASSIADALYDLEVCESAPKVMPHAIRAFGLKARTSNCDVALMQ
jgi:hypothetical protein